MHSVFSRLLRKFPESAHTLRRTQTLTTVGLFLAIQMVLSSYGTIQVNDSLKISLAHLALAPTAMLFGPVAAAIQGAMSDILGFLLKPTGPYFPGFTISAALGGVLIDALGVRAMLLFAAAISAAGTLGLFFFARGRAEPLEG